MPAPYKPSKIYTTRPRVQLCSMPVLKTGSELLLGFQEVKSFKYLVISNEGSKPEILSRIAKTTAAFFRLKPIWRDENISLASGARLMRTLISTFLYACEGWILIAELERSIQALEKLLKITHKDHVTNEEVCYKIHCAIGKNDDLLSVVKKRKVRWYGHISRDSGMVKTILQGTVKKQEGEEDREKEQENIKDWTRLEFGESVRAVQDREEWRRIVETSSVVFQRPSRLKN